MNWLHREKLVFVRGGTALRSLRLCGEIFLLSALLAVPSPAVPQKKSAYRYFAPAFAYGRILIAATDKYVVVAMDTAPPRRVPPGAIKDARFPVVVPIGGRSLAILTGAVEWFDLMDQNAPGIEAQTWFRSREARSLGAGERPPPTLGQPRLDRGESTVSLIEVIVEGIAEKLHEYAVDYHAKAELPKDAPLLSVLWVNYTMDGPVVWTARYPFTQQWRAEDFYLTRLERPRTRDLLKFPEGLAFAEEGYPEPGHLLELLERLKAQDSSLRSGQAPQLEKIWSQPSMALVLSALKAGKGKKITAQQATDFCRALLEASAPVSTEERRVGLLVVDEEGARWIHKPEVGLPNPP